MTSFERLDMQQSIFLNKASVMRKRFDFTLQKLFWHRLIKFTTCCFFQVTKLNQFLFALHHWYPESKRLLCGALLCKGITMMVTVSKFRSYPSRQYRKWVTI